MNDDIPLFFPTVQLTLTASFRQPITFDEKRFTKRFGKQYNREHKKTNKNFVRILPVHGRWSGAELVINEYYSDEEGQSRADAVDFAIMCLSCAHLPEKYDGFDKSLDGAMEDLRDLLKSQTIMSQSAVYNITHGDINFVITTRIDE